MVVLPKYDEFFKGIFRNETVRRHFIGDVLGISQEDIRCVELKNTFLWKRCWRQKLGILDVVLELNGSRKVNIELQVKPVKDWDKRQLFYLSRLYSEEVVHRCTNSRVNSTRYPRPLHACEARRRHHYAVASQTHR